MIIFGTHTFPIACVAYCVVKNYRTPRPLAAFILFHVRSLWWVHASCWMFAVRDGWLVRDTMARRSTADRLADAPVLRMTVISLGGGRQVLALSHEDAHATISRLCDAWRYFTGVVTLYVPGPDLRGDGGGRQVAPGPKTPTNRGRPTKPFVLLFIVDDRCLRDYDLVVARCRSLF